MGPGLATPLDSAAFDDPLHLHPTVQAVSEYNVAKLCNAGEPTATIKAVHTGPNGSKASSEDASGLEPVILLVVLRLRSPMDRCWPCKWSSGNTPGHLLPEWGST